MNCRDCGWPLDKEHVDTEFGPVHRDSCYTSWKPCIGGCGVMLPFRVARCLRCSEAFMAESEQRHAAKQSLARIREESRFERWMRLGDELEVRTEYEDKLDREAQEYYSGLYTDEMGPDERRIR